MTHFQRYIHYLELYDSEYLRDIHGKYGDKGVIFEKFSTIKHSFNFGIKEFLF